MSGVYFRGMKMPEACNVCPAHHFYFPPVKFADDEVLTTAVAVCMAVGKELPTLSQENQKPDWCPAISVPDHGKLIDADATVETLKRLRKYHLDDSRSGGFIALAPGLFYFYTEFTASILPAEHPDR